MSRCHWRLPVNTEATDRAPAGRGRSRCDPCRRHGGRWRRSAIEFLNDEAIGHLRARGCRVEGQMVRFDGDFVEANGGPRPPLHAETRKPQRSG